MPNNPASRSTQIVATKTSRADIDTGLRQFMISVYNYMASGLALTGVVAYGAAVTGLYASLINTPLLFWGVTLAPLALVLLLSFRIEIMSLGAAKTAFWAYAALVGLSLSGIFFVYTGTSIARTFFVAAATFLAMSLYGYTTRTDLARTGSFLLMGLFGIIIASLVNLFLRSTQLDWLISIVGVGVFAGLTAYDTQRIKAMYDWNDDATSAGRKAVIGALSLYLNFINLFMMLLRLAGNRR